MQPILLKKVDSEIRKQYAFLRKLDKSLTIEIPRSVSLFYVLTTIGFILLYTVTDANSFIVLKGASFILIGLMWLTAVIIILWLFIKIHRHSRLVDSLMQAALNTEIEYYITFDEDKLTFITNEVKTEVVWSYWHGYAEVEEMLVLFVKGYLYSTNTFSDAEIGLENLEQLKAIVRRKVIKLDDKDQKQYTLLFSFR